MTEPPYTERYVRWCERKALMGKKNMRADLLDLHRKSNIGEEIAKLEYHFKR